MSVDMRPEMHSFFLDLAQSREGEYLKSAGIRQYRTLPGRKLPHAAKVTHHFITRAQMEMISIGEHDLRADLFQICRRDRTLDGADGPDVHENRRLNRSVHCIIRSAFCPSVFRNDLIIGH